MEREVLLAVRQQPRQCATADDGDEDADSAADHGQDNAFRQQLTNDPPATGAEAEPDRHLARASRRAREQQIRRVRARDRQDQPHHGQQHVKRLRVLTPQTVESSAALLEAQRRKIRALPIVARGRGDPLSERSRERGLGLREFDAGFQPPHHLDPVVVLIHKPIPLRLHELAGTHRDKDLRGGGRINAKKL